MRLATRRSDERGTVMVLSTFGVVLAMIAAALAVDLGRLAQDGRFDQKVADLAALDASRDLTTACARAKVSVERNGFDPDNLICSDPANDPTADVVIGKWSSGAFIPDLAGNAVKVTARAGFKAAFPFVRGPDRTKADAVASTAPIATFYVGSTLATIDTTRATMLNGILSTLAEGSAVNITAVGYNGLTTQNVTLSALQTQLLALGNDVGTTDKLLNSDIEVADILTATANALNAPGTSAGDHVAAATINSIPIASISSLTKIKLGDLFSLDQPADDAALATALNVFQLVTGAAVVANGTNAVSFNAGINAGGVSVGDVDVTLVEGPKWKTGPVGASVNTAQAKVTLNLGVSVLGVGVVGVGITFTAGDATTTLTGIRCSAADPGIDLNVTTGAVTSTVSAAVLGVPLAISAPATGGADVDLEFDYSGDFGVANARHVGATGLGVRPSFTGAGLGATIAGLLNTAFGTLGLWNSINNLVDPIFRSLGIDVGAADVAAIGIIPPPPACGQPRLVG